MKARTTSATRGRLPGAILLGAVLLFIVMPVSAQRPVRMFDPFYRGEAAHRTFYDRYAVTAELSYRPPGLLQADESVTGIGVDPVGVHLLIEYQLTPYLDAGAYVDASGNAGGRSLGLSWLMLKYMRHEEGVDYAVRLAIDPSSDARGGFPQMDLGFLYETDMSGTVSTDFGVGLRRVRIGFQELVPVDPVPIDPEGPIGPAPAPSTELLRSRAVGWEMNMSSSYRIVFDPAGSNLFVSALAQGGKYDLVEWEASGSGRSSMDYRGGVVWVRSGLEIERPGFVFMPYLSIPVTQWAPSDGEWPGHRARVGVRFTLR